MVDGWCVVRTGTRCKRLHHGLSVCLSVTAAVPCVGWWLVCSMYWNKVRVTAKRLHREHRPGAHVDLLINELDFMS